MSNIFVVSRWNRNDTKNLKAFTSKEAAYQFAVEKLMSTIDYGGE